VDGKGKGVVYILIRQWHTEPLIKAELTKIHSEEK